MAPDADAGKSAHRADPFAPLTSEQLAVGDGHEIYVESVGRLGGIAAVYLHGGPGSGCQPDHRRLFDPERFHAVLFDQRGAGRSRPKGSREHNTLPHLIADMEMIREKFGFERWMVVGGSWGATLALAYAQAHPETRQRHRAARDLSRHPRGTRQRLSRGAAALLSRSQRGFSQRIAAGRTRTSARCLLAPHSRSRSGRARPRGARLGTRPSAFCPNMRRAASGSISLRCIRALPSTPFMEAHYFRNDCFMKPDQLMNDAEKLAGIPGIIVQGRYDLLCPPATSHALAA